MFLYRANSRTEYSQWLWRPYTLAAMEAAGVWQIRGKQEALVLEFKMNQSNRNKTIPSPYFFWHTWLHGALLFFFFYHLFNLLFFPSGCSDVHLIQILLLPISKWVEHVAVWLLSHQPLSPSTQPPVARSINAGITIIVNQNV